VACSQSQAAARSLRAVEQIFGNWGKARIVQAS
jgi:hypothetical protein